jgi:hypothetical protein
LLTGGITIVASLGIGTGVKWIAEQIGNHKRLKRTNSIASGTDVPLLNGMSTAWHFVTTLQLLDSEARRFTTDTIVGYVLRDEGTNGNRKQGQIVALSAACLF